MIIPSKADTQIQARRDFVVLATASGRARKHMCDRGKFIATPPHARALCRKEIWKRAKMVPTFLELRVMRLKWWQQIARDSKDGRHENDQVLAAILGALEDEEEQPLDGEGRLRPQANHWARQMQQDFDALAANEGTAGLHEDAAGRITTYFGEHAERFSEA